MPGDFVAVDCETTGTDPERDRIVEVAVVRDGSRRAWRVFPGVPIPAEATAVHGIADADVAASPRFADVAHEVAAALAGAIVVTFNGRAFDLPLLRAECERAGFAWPLAAAATDAERRAPPHPEVVEGKDASSAMPRGHEGFGRSPGTSMGPGSG